MAEADLGIIIPVIVALVMSIPGILGFFRIRNKDKVEGIAIVKSAAKSEAEATEVLVTAATSLLDPLLEKIERLERRDLEREFEVEKLSRRLTRTERNNYILCDGVRRLILQLGSLGAKPVFDVDEELCNEIANGGDMQREFKADRLT